ncbi:hypothetical protein HIM_04338 [Hirsutella minnesotensis 3608]|uniref:Uncharacterized protein n=1 Tax=Hirsutella minnesotensis 3608 TaxID=1043627 RepID=A0A0F7ZLC7_9HYPO|nr:hypothetical protein HIM_04338 [Hirsutella minnesotensis 3608]
MENQASPPPLTPPPTTHRELASSQPTPARPTRPSTPLGTLSTSEPFLRFPRPQGNRRLANWISASDPDIMHLTTTADELGLAESTYELITGTDNESQDGNYTESIEGSICSLDAHRPDDVHSLDGTEYTQDGESIAGDVDVLPRMTIQDDFDDLHGDVIHPGAMDDKDDTLVAQSREFDGFDVKDGTCSQTSLEYTHHSLGTPSITSPEGGKLGDAGSGVSERPSVLRAKQVGDQPSHVGNKVARLWEASADVREYLLETTSAAFPGLLFTIAVALLIPAIYTTLSPKHGVQLPAVTSTVTATTTLVLSATKTPTRARIRPTWAGRMDLIPLGDDSSDEWIWSAKKPTISFSPQAQTNVLVHITKDVKQNWLAKDCLEITAFRDGQQIETSSSSVNEGLVIRFPRKEAFGIVDLSLDSTCRPRIHKMVKVHFGKGVMEEALERTKNFALDISGLVPAAAQEAERCLVGARRSFGAMSDSVGNSVVFVSDNVLSKVDHALSEARQSLGDATADAKRRVEGAADVLTRSLDSVSRQAKGQLSKVHHTQRQLQLALLNAQVSANLWWLGATGRREERDDYQRKAKDFLTQKRTVVREAMQSKRSEEQSVLASRLWPRLQRQGRCQDTHGRGGKSTHQCKVDI